MEILTITIKYDGSGRFSEIVEKAIEKTGCFIVKKIEHDYVVGAENPGCFFLFGSRFREMQLSTIH